MKVTSYVLGNWVDNGAESELTSAVTGERIATLFEADLNYKSICDYARSVGGPELRRMSISGEISSGAKKKVLRNFRSYRCHEEGFLD